MSFIYTQGQLATSGWSHNVDPSVPVELITDQGTETVHMASRLAVTTLAATTLAAALADTAAQLSPGPNPAAASPAVKGPGNHRGCSC